MRQHRILVTLNPISSGSPSGEATLIFNSFFPMDTKTLELD